MAMQICVEWLLIDSFMQYGCGQNLATNALKHLMDQLEERILQTDQLKNASKRLQRIALTVSYVLCIMQESVMWSLKVSRLSSESNNDITTEF